MATIPGVIFDMDGVIVHSNPAHKEAIQIFCEKHNLDVSDPLLENKVYGRTNKEWIPEVFGDISAEKLKKLADDKEQLFRDIFEPEENIVSGIHDFLDRLKENDIPMAVATSAPGENADYILSSLSITSYFDTVLDSSDVTIGKPHPEVYRKAAKALGKTPEDTIVFEDSIAGVKAGLSAGASVVGVTTTHTTDEFDPCHLFIENFESLEVQQLSELSRERLAQ
ncbi:HAD family hydrolase [Fodinibius salsisoli]|uniref:HAD family phosphatase n=1 Tax=Fodinibius salsisoli TaxID=2820877 RepID=A0ABT3PJ00_9BACT|nr:HAD family phosphatase [Fodinibius salsisoli]MCW9705902.1 HAD family phosphatase [Fodinibius salsisoli]